MGVNRIGTSVAGRSETVGNFYSNTNDSVVGVGINKENDMLKLDNEDIKVLMEALDALEGKTMHDVLLESVLEVGMSADRDEAKKKMVAKLQNASDNLEPLRERVIILKAKLIQMKDKNVVDEAVHFSTTL